MSGSDIGIIVAAVTASLGLVVSFTNWLRTQSVKDAIIDSLETEIKGIKALSPPVLADWVKSTQEIYTIRAELLEQEHERQVQLVKSQGEAAQVALQKEYDEQRAANQREIDYWRALAARFEDGSLTVNVADLGLRHLSGGIYINPEFVSIPGWEPARGFYSYNLTPKDEENDEEKAAE